MKPLNNITVIDLSKVFAGPHCAQLLGEFGADIIKVEPVDMGDDTRAFEPRSRGQSSIFLAFNRNKRSLAVDLKTARGRAIIHDLAAQADVVIQGFKGGTAARLGVDYETLAALNERLIYCEISGFGSNGPLAGQPGYDVMLQAFSGMISTMGEPDGPLARASFSPVDMTTGMLGVSAILAALLERNRTGRGSHIELSLLDSAMSLMGYLAQNYWMTGVAPKPMGSAHPALAPYQAFDAKDRKLMIGAGNDAQWRKLCAVADLRDHAQDPRFATNAARVERMSETAGLIQGAIGKKPAAHWLKALGEAGVPCTPIHDMAEALAHPQIAAQGLVVTPEHPVLGAFPQIGLPITFDGAPRATPRPAPGHGEHSVEILERIGLDPAEIAELTELGVIYDGREQGSKP
jgi:formyl-CoA transferase